ncbi:MAG: DUF3387 domain-containing protein [Rubrobacter sp.]|nr:DUF3387 domain-containing protein [Rubrobacter sp.]
MRGDRFVKRILRRNSYPPDTQEQATTRTVLEQAEALSQDWIGSLVHDQATSWSMDR